MKRQRLIVGLLALALITVFVTVTRTVEAGPGGTGNGDKKKTPPPTATFTPAATATPTDTPTATATSTPLPTPLPTFTPTPLPTLTPTPTATPTPVSDAVAFQVDAAHDGATASNGLALPLSPRWTVNLGGSISYPLIAQGKVFVTVANTSGYGTALYALDASTGQSVWGPVAIPGTYFWSNAAYDSGTLFVVNFDGLLQAFDANAGTLKWRQQLPGQTSFTSPPTASQGVVYTAGSGSGGTLYAVDESTGQVLWTQPVTNGQNSAPTLSSDGVFVSYSCPNVYKFSLSNTGTQWQYSTGCSGGGGTTAVYYQGRLYVRDTAGYIFDAQNGSIIGSFPNGTSPAFSGTLGYVQSGGKLLAFDSVSGLQAWSFAGDGALSSAPLVVGPNVIVGSSTGNLYAVAAATGELLWSGSVGAAISAPDEQNVSQPLTGLNAGDGLLIVPAGSTLAAYSGN